MLENLTYWNVDKQEAYYSYIEASVKREEKLINYTFSGHGSISIDRYFLKSFFQEYFLNIL